MGTNIAVIEMLEVSIFIIWNYGKIFKCITLWKYEEIIIHNCDRCQNWFWAQFTVNIPYIMFCEEV